MISSGAFLQSTAWEHFQRSIGRMVHRNGEVLLVRKEVGLGVHYWYVGRALTTQAPDHATFLRVDLPQEAPLPNAVPAPHDVQPSTTIILDVTKSTEQLLAEMHPKTRYNIRVAQKRGVTVAEYGSEAFETFWDLLQSTTARNAFRGHGKAYYKKLLEMSDAQTRVFLAVASIDGTPAAVAMMLDYQGVRTYLHGASDYQLREAMAPYALHWHLIVEAKNAGCEAYDFWGIAPDDNPKHRLAGVTRFKKGWGGDIIHYPKTQDLILRPFAYKLYRFLHQIREWL